MINLCGKWNWKEEKSDDVYCGNVPGTLLGDMLSLGLIEDPYYKKNEYNNMKILDKDYCYFKEFELTNEMLKEKIFLEIKGIDTVADIYLNNELVANIYNMHIEYNFDVTRYLKEKNIIEIHFKSPLKYIYDKRKDSGIFYTSTGSILGNGFIRKAHYMYGWDWGPKLPDLGIFRGIYLKNEKRIKDVYIKQKHKENKVILNIEYDINFMDCKGTITVTNNDFKLVKKIEKNSNSLELEIENPKLWWPNGYGEQNLYKIHIRLFNGGLVEESQLNIGLRTLWISTEKDKWGNEFAFVINGQKIFAMGANYIPEDNLLGRLSRERSKLLIEDCVKANFNCLRIWGGGYYPEEYFYELCDEMGIIVWQDLMYACNVYSLDDDFEKNIISETENVVKRIRNHASLGLWCGNNEMEWGWDDWGRLEGHNPKYKIDYIKIFEYILPKVVKKLDSETFYWNSSPSSGGNLDFPNDFNRGDNHYWEVWHSNKPFTEYREFCFRFCSEYGFQSFPNIKTLETFAEKEDLNIFSEVMESHQKNNNANVKIFSYISEYYKYPKDMENIAYISQVLQLKAIQYGVEHWRRNWGRCMGSLYWQLNDCWPVASWSSIDYYGRWKALHYGAKRFYGRTIVSAMEREELSTKIDYYIHNESFKEENYKFIVRLVNKNFDILFEDEINIETSKFTTNEIYSIDYEKYIVDKKEVIAEYILLSGYKVVSRGTTLFVKPKHFNFEKPKYTVTLKNGILNIKSQTYVSYLEIDCDVNLEDNFIDITNKEGVTLYVGEDFKLENLTLRSVAESY